MTKNMIKKKGFTLIEITIVVSIVAILMVSLKGIFQLKNKNLNYAQVCVNNLYGKVNNFLNASATSKGLYIDSATGTIFPNYYFVDFNITNQYIALAYATDTTTGSYRYYPLTGVAVGDIVPSFSCRAMDYNIVLSGDTDTYIRINKGLQQLSPSNLGTFTILDTNKNPQITGETLIFLCDKQNISCQEIAMFTVDSRTQYIKKKTCIGFAKNLTCETWDQ